VEAEAGALVALRLAATAAPLQDLHSALLG